MGNAAARAQPASPLDSASQYRTYLMDYSYSNLNIVFNSILADSKFFKTIKCKCDDGMMVVIKLYRQYDLQETLTSVHTNLRLLSSILSPLESVPNVIPYADYQFSSKHHVAFLVRQYFAMNLYDRVLSRPFLSNIEKKWITFQLLKALEQCHKKGICHGDVKLENLMIVTWNWLFLTDFAPFKPTYIPEDDPSEYHYYFCAMDGSGRSCSVAPERFYSPNSERKLQAEEAGAKENWVTTPLNCSSPASHAVSQSRLGAGMSSPESISGSYSKQHYPISSHTLKKEGSLLESMDVFSAGCAIAELFLGGKPLFDLPALLKYRRTGDTNHLQAMLKKIQDPVLEELLLDMLQLDPNARKSASQYLSEYANRIFPAYFEAFLFRFLALVLSRGGRVPDARVRLVCKYYGRLAKEIAGVEDVEGEAFFKQRLKEGYGADRHVVLADLEPAIAPLKDSAAGGPSHVAQRVLEELENRSKKIRSMEINAAPGATDVIVPPSPAQPKDFEYKEREMGIKLHGNEQKKKIEKLHDQYNAIAAKRQLWTQQSAEDKEEEASATTKPPAEDAILVDGQSRPPIAKKSAFAAACARAYASRPSNQSPLDPHRVQSDAISSMRLRTWGPDKNGIMIILSLVCSSLRHVQVPETKRTALFLIHSLSRFTDDEVRLQRCIPFLLEILKDSAASVRALAIRTVTFVLDLITCVPLSDATVFSQYILDAMNPFPFDPDESVRIAFAECLPRIASSSRRFLELTQAIKPASFTPANTSAPFSSISTSFSIATPTKNSQGISSVSSCNSLSALHSPQAAAPPSSYPPLQLASNTFDKELNRLHKMISRFVIQLAAYDQKTSSSLVKRALLVDISRLCLFFGRERTLDVVLPQLIAFLNDKDWQVRAAFFEAVPRIATLLGKQTVELYILPCIEQALIDIQELVITNAVHCLRALLTMGLFQASNITQDPAALPRKRSANPSFKNYYPLDSILNKVTMILPLIVHPCWWIRDAVLKLLVDIVLLIGYVDANVFLIPLLRPFLNRSILIAPLEKTKKSEEEEILLQLFRDAVRAFVPRSAFDAALVASSLVSPEMKEAGDTDVSVASRKDIARGLELMQQYLAVASTHLQSKIELAHVEQTARIQAPNSTAPSTSAHARGNMSADITIGSQRAHLYAIQVPDMRFALMLAQPLKMGNLMMSSTNGTAAPANISNTLPSPVRAVAVPASNASCSALFPIDNLSLGLIIKMYGLFIPATPTWEHSGHGPNPETLYNALIGDPFGSMDSAALAKEWQGYDNSSSTLNAPAMIYCDGRFAYNSSLHRSSYGSARSKAGGTHAAVPTGLPHVPIASNSFMDPAVYVPRKLLSRLTALGIPPLPADFGALRLSDGSMYSIYAHPNSPHNIFTSSGTSFILPNSQSSFAGSGNYAELSEPGTSSGTAASAKYSSPMSILGGPLGTGALNSNHATAAHPSPSISSTSSSQTGVPYGNTSSSSYSRCGWRPQKNILVAELSEHSGAVMRVSAAQDYSFFASASQDGTVKLWSVRSLQHNVNQTSRCTYDAQGGVLTDMLVLNNCHSVASTSTDGSIHVFRVDKLSNGSSIGNTGKKSNFQATDLKELKVHDQAVIVLDHLNTVSECLLVYATRDGTIYAWDLRMRRLAWTLYVSPELGYITAMTHAMDVMWLVIGTSRGFLCVWDLRFLILIRIWQHSSQRMIYRMKPCVGLTNTSRVDECHMPLVFVVAADGDVAVFDLSIGACRAVFRTLHAQATDAEACQCPALLHVPIPHRDRQVLGSYLGMNGIASAFEEIATPLTSEELSVRAILAPNSYFRNVNDAIITGGEDRQLRYWDLRNGKNAFTICGEGDATSFYDQQAAPSDWWRITSATAQTSRSATRGNATPRGKLSAKSDSGWESEDSMSGRPLPPPLPSMSPGAGGISKAEMAWSHLSPPSITICQDSSYMGNSMMHAWNAIAMERRGLVSSSPAHTDCILDLALVDMNGPMLISSGRDGLIKVWR